MDTQFWSKRLWSLGVSKFFLIKNLTTGLFMKICPQCNQIYDDTENFCQTDGSVLVSPRQSAETVIVKAPATNFQHSQPVTKQPNLHLISGAILLLAIIAVGFAVAYFTTKNDDSKKETVAKSEVKENANSNVSVKVADKELNTTPPLSVEAVKGLLQKWEAAQDKQSFSAYQDCYGSPFKGIKTTNKSETVYDYSGWMADRRKMLNTAIEKLTDMVSPEIHPKAKVVKDLAAGAVLMASIAAAVIGLIVFLPKVVN